MITDEQVAAIEALGAKYPGHYMAKFCVDPRQWDREATAIWEQIGSYTLSERMLDLGCGFGYFANVINYPAADVTGLDLPEPIIAEAAAILQVPFVPHVVSDLDMVPSECGGPYDLITMFGCTLRHGHPATSKDYWGWDEYRFFFADVATRIRPGGRFVIRPNVMIDESPTVANLLDHGALRRAVGDGWKRVVIRGREIILMKGER